MRVIDGDGVDALQLELVEQFGDACFNIVNNLVATFLASEVTAQRLDVLLQHFVGVLVNLIKSST